MGAVMPGAATAARRPLRVLILRQGHYPDDPRVRRAVGALTARGHSVDVVCLGRAGEAARETVAGARVFRVPLAHRRGGRWRYAWEYGAFFVAAAGLALALHLRRRYAVVEAHSLPDGLVFAALGPRCLGARVVLDLHEVMPELVASLFGLHAAHPLVRITGRVEQAAIRFADACLAVSDPCAEAFVRRGAPAGKLTVVMNSADPALFPPPDPSAAPSGAGPGGPRPLRVVSHGTLVDRHGFDVLLHAAARLSTGGGPDFELRIMGDGEARGALEALARDLGLGERVTFEGHRPLDEVARRLEDADVGVVANRRDAFMDLVVPTKLMEYAALGIPAVVSRTPAVERYFDGRMVRYFAPGDAADLAAALAEVLGDPGLRRRLADAARRGFCGRHGWPGMAARYVDLIEALAGVS
ncbi:hypothetical protein DCC79_16095 [bacterium]|nr:MAG: hypothetical protein DCC79_16095 [bacterium]